jgi:hypothetical protein
MSVMTQPTLSVPLAAPIGTPANAWLANKLPIVPHPINFFSALMIYFLLSFCSMFPSKLVKNQNLSEHFGPHLIAVARQ